ncbi:MAG: bifunctional phosphopantothenoylcysteine decarboxylase/phosphopantothenate--cysteine ligase CoaBC [Eubacteriales bacterium]|nr:bifunctional phosphopantothenoylcysteine decarboxylase/phosphopantothenate--cysteine ligase CoaBC [Clostridiales bacterium]MDD7494125.1 bifunctional phosphopantothenoylcysteine decarboxylase/phosphopantothenate--cysteine ligase CoaBC [Clostridiales bacterium]MDY5709626.1 bifunctional phosphopantothenoylcysteine decarboxylase/phosphopantothenate--cysteine ligase CoaBC [Eubacteriales bacterium]MDY5801370.1 bifunctional phosphopantothenoylcysteine decarboxylase/phosphopantothenate--cysteine liga
MKHVVMGVTGSIAAYKACDIISALRKSGVDVHVILTHAGAEIITPLTLETISGNRVVKDMFDSDRHFEVEHISLAKLADLFLVAPATANFIGKMASGIADDMLTTTVMATTAPVMIAPAMNTNMYLDAATQANIETLKRRGCEFIAPATGHLACGDEGIGKLAAVEDIVRAVLDKLNVKRDLEGKRVLVTAGPTREAIDPVRYITNRSSGKMGYAIAEAAAERGADVTLISGPVSLRTPDGVKRVDIVSSDELCDSVIERFPGCDILVMAAAPADFTPAEFSSEKIKKGGDNLTLNLRATRDILKTIAPLKSNQKVMGFAAETHNVENNAIEKLKRKKLDFIAANDVTAEGAGFGTDTNIITLYGADGSREHSGMVTKREAADWLLDRLVK